MSKRTIDELCFNASAISCDPAIPSPLTELKEMNEKRNKKEVEQLKHTDVSDEFVFKTAPMFLISAIRLFPDKNK